MWDNVLDTKNKNWYIIHLNGSWNKSVEMEEKRVVIEHIEKEVIMDSEKKNV
jgi:hypothetical protein